MNSTESTISWMKMKNEQEKGQRHILCQALFIYSKNKISIIFFSDFEAMITALLIPLVILAAKLSFSINLFLGIVLAIIIIAIDIFIALKISNYFAKILIE